MLAEDLKALNDSRKEMTEKGVEEAVQMIESTSLKDDKVLVVYLPDCHESIAGIIAGRIKERYYRPAKGGGRREGLGQIHRVLRYVRPDVPLPGAFHQVRRA